MGYDIGPKIGVDGEAEFRVAIKNLNTSLKTLGTEMGAVTSQFGKNQQSEEALTAKNKVLNKEIESQKDKLSKLKEGLAQSAAKYGENDEKTQKWQQAVNKAQETLNKQKNELDDNEKSLENLKNGVDDAAVSEQDATKKTSVFGEVLKANLTSTAIKSGIQCIKDGFSKIAQGIQSATGKLKDAVTESVEYGDNVDKMSQKLGMSTDAYQKWSYVTERAGTSIDGMKGGMKKLSTEAQSNAKEFQKLGISQKDVKSLNQENLFEKTIEGLAGMKSGTERTALASKLLGKSAVELGPLLNEGTGEIKKQMDIAERYGLVMSEKAVKGSAEFEDSLTTLRGVITGLRNKFIGEFYPSLTLVTDGLSKMFSGVDTSGGLKSIDTGIKQFSEKLNQILPHVQEVGGKILSTLGQAIATNLPTILSSATKITSTITTGIINAAPMLISSGAQIVVALINGISQNLPKIIPAVVSAVKQIGATIRQHSGEIGKALDASIPGATKSLEKLKKAFEVILPAVLLAKGAVEGFKVASAISGVISGVTKVLGLQTTATQAQTLAQTGLNGVMKANDTVSALTFKLYDGTANGTIYTVSGNNTAAQPLSIDNPFIHTTVQALSAARCILTMYGGNQIEISSRGDPASELGDVDSVQLDKSQATSARRFKQEFAFQNGIMCRLPSTLLQANGYRLFKSQVVITADSTWTAPSGVTVLRVILVGGGTGGESGTDGTWDADGAAGADGAGGKVFSSEININSGQTFTVKIGAGGAAGGGSGEATTMGAYSSATGTLYDGFTDINDGTVFARDAVDLPLANSGDGGRGGNGGAKGNQHTETYEAMVLNADGRPWTETRTRTVVDSYPMPGTPGAAGGSGCVIIYYDKAVTA